MALCRVCTCGSRVGGGAELNCCASQSEGVDLTSRMDWPGRAERQREV